MKKTVERVLKAIRANLSNRHKLMTKMPAQQSCACGVFLNTSTLG
jgi:hypothetical protein